MNMQHARNAKKNIQENCNLPLMPTTITTAIPLLIIGNHLSRQISALFALHRHGPNLIESGLFVQDFGVIFCCWEGGDGVDSFSGTV
mgnify:CR=1 FL=1